MPEADIALIGLAVMGQNLVLNMNDHGYSVAVFNRTASRTGEFLSGPARGRSTIIPVFSIRELIGALKRPRKILLMVKAGSVVDSFIDQLAESLDSGDVIIDGGNSHFSDTKRRTAALEEKGIFFIGAGISGGEEGARHGPSIMPGGSETAWPLIKPIFQAIAAKTEAGDVCCDWIGSGGAGHFVKMVHNGIEYGDMQLIGEVYDLMKHGLGLSNSRMAEIFRSWNARELESYLVGISADILSFTDENGNHVIDSILDTAGQKGTGKWTGINALEQGAPVTLICEAVFARNVSAMKELRIEASGVFGPGPVKISDEIDIENMLANLGEALLAAKIVSYAQGFMMLKDAAQKYDWKLDYGSIALMWREGCIIRSAFLDNIKQAYDRNRKLQNLLLDDYFSSIIRANIKSWRTVVKFGIERGIAMPALSSGLAFFDGFRRERTPANFLQAQRDYFGAHMYQRTDDPEKEYHHTDWTGSGGKTASTSYIV